MNVIGCWLRQGEASGKFFLDVGEGPVRKYIKLGVVVAQRKDQNMVWVWCDENTRAAVEYLKTARDRGAKVEVLHRELVEAGFEPSPATLPLPNDDAEAEAQQRAWVERLGLNPPRVSYDAAWAKRLGLDRSLGEQAAPRPVAIPPVNGHQGRLPTPSPHRQVALLPSDPGRDAGTPGDDPSEEGDEATSQPGRYPTPLPVNRSPGGVGTGYEVAGQPSRGSTGDPATPSPGDKAASQPVGTRPADGSSGGGASPAVTTSTAAQALREEQGGQEATPPGLDPAGDAAGGSQGAPAASAPEAAGVGRRGDDGSVPDPATGGEAAASPDDPAAPQGGEMVAPAAARRQGGDPGHVTAVAQLLPEAAQHLMVVLRDEQGNQITRRMDADDVSRELTVLSAKLHERRRDQRVAWRTTTVAIAAAVLCIVMTLWVMRQGEDRERRDADKHKEVVSEKDRSIEEKVRLLSERDQKLRDLDLRIATMQGQVAEKDVTLASLREERQQLIDRLAEAGRAATSQPTSRPTTEPSVVPNVAPGQ